MAAKSFQSWVSREDIEATMGVDYTQGDRKFGTAVVDAGGPGVKVRYVDLPVDVFGIAGDFVGLAFDGELYLLAEIERLLTEQAREFAERDDLVVEPCFLFDRRLAGFQVRVLGGGK